MTNLLLARRPKARDAFNGAALQQQWVKTDTENKLTLSGGTLVCAGGKAAPAYDDPRATWSRPLTPCAGLTFECDLTWTAFGGTGMQFGLDTENPVAATIRLGFRVDGAGQLRILQWGGTVVIVPVTLALNTAYRFRVVLLGAGGTVWLFSATAGRTWTPVWQEGTVAVGTLRAGVTNNDAAWKLDTLRVYQGSVPAPTLSDAFAARTAPGRADTGQPWLTVSTKPLPTIAGDARTTVAGEAWLQAWTGVAEGIWEFDLNFGSAPSTNKAVYCIFHFRDLNNYTRVSFNRVTQTITLVKVANAVTVNGASLAATGWVDNTPYRFRVVAVGASLKVYQDGVERLSTSEEFGRYFGLFSFYLIDNLATPDIRVDNVKVWGTPARPLLMDAFDGPDTSLLGAEGIAPRPAESGQPYASVGTWNYWDGRIAAGNAGGASDPLAQAALAQGGYLMTGIYRAQNLTLARTGGMVLRWQDATNYVLVRVISPPSQAIAAFKNVAGSRVSVGGSALFAAQAATDHVIAAVVLGNTIEVYADGTRYVSTTVTEFPNTPAAGPYTSQGIANLGLDDLRYLPLGAGALVHDTFTRADSAVTLGSTELPGAAWLATGTWGISTNQAYNVDTSGIRIAAVPVLVPDVDVQADIVRQGGTVGVATRCTTTFSDYLIVRFDGTTCDVAERVASGGLVQIGSAVAFVWAASGIAKAIRVRVFNGTVSVYADGVLVRTQAFTGHATAAENGYGLYNVSAGATTNRFDTFSVKEVTA